VHGAACAGQATHAQQSKVFASVFTKKDFFLLCFFEKKNQKTFANLEAHQQPAAMR
jgi:hypothetical protein